MASRLNEDLMNTNLDIPDGEIKIEGKVNPVYADAINVHNKKKKEIEKVLKDKKPELKKAFLGTKGETTIMPKTKELKKLKLAENMFKKVREHYEDAPKVYGEIYRVVDNMEHIINYINDLTEDELTYEDMKQSYDVLEEAMDEFKDYLEEVKEAEENVSDFVESKNHKITEATKTIDRKKIAKQDRINNQDRWSNIYNELVSMKSCESPNRQLKGKDITRYGSDGDPAAVQVGLIYIGDEDGIAVRANKESDLDFGKQVAELYDAEYEVKEHTSRYATFKYELLIYPYRNVPEETPTKGKSKKTKNEDLKIYRESDLTDFEFWSGARDTVKYLTDDEIRTIGNYLEDIYPEGCTETDINDFFWFEDDTIAEWLGYNSFEEIMDRDKE